MPSSKTSTMMIDDFALNRFRLFVGESEALLRRESDDQTARFKEFVRAAESIVLDELPQTVVDLKPAIDALEAWLLRRELDILREARATWDEDAYTNLLAWWLSPNTDPDTKLQRQQAFLNTIKLPEASRIESDEVPHVQLHTDDGIPDMVLKYSDFAVVVEAKTGTYEHETPQSEQPQTVAYHAAVRRHFAIPIDVPIYTVFLTIDGSAAANEEAYNLSFFELALAIAMQFRPAEFAPPVGALIQAWLSHLFHEADPPGLELDALVTQLRIHRAETTPNPKPLLRHLHTITLLHDATLRLKHD